MKRVEELKKISGATVKGYYVAHANKNVQRAVAEAMRGFSPKIVTLEIIDLGEGFGAIGEIDHKRNNNRKVVRQAKHAKAQAQRLLLIRGGFIVVKVYCGSNDERFGTIDQEKLPGYIKEEIASLMKRPINPI